MSERLKLIIEERYRSGHNGAVSKTVRWLIAVTWVQIPSSPFRVSWGDVRAVESAVLERL